MSAKVRGPALPLKSHFLFDFGAEVKTSIDLPKAGGVRTIAPFIGGWFSGPEVQGTLLGEGGDWGEFRDSRTLTVDVRATLKTDADEYIYMAYSGIWIAHKANFAEIFSEGGFQNYKPQDHYLRVAARFETNSTRLAWMNDLLAIGSGVLTESGGVAYSFYRID
jgi:Protein of unknown function (DUF3237)